MEIPSLKLPETGAIVLQWQKLQYLHRMRATCIIGRCHHVHSFCIIQPSAIFSFQGRNEPRRGQDGEFLRTNEKCPFKWGWSCAPIRIKLAVFWIANEKTVKIAWLLRRMKKKACSRKTIEVKWYWVRSKGLEGETDNPNSEFLAHLVVSRSAKSLMSEECTRQLQILPSGTLLRHLVS